MALTAKEAKEIIAPFAGRAGKCPSTGEVDLFLKEVLQYLLNAGEYGNLRKFCFVAEKGCFTAPPDLETPLKAKIDNEVSSVWDRWFEWYSTRDIDGCTIVGSSILEEPNRTPLVYEIPGSCSHIGVLAFCAEDDGAHILIQGEDVTGAEVYTVHKGQKIHGEYLALVKNQIRFTHIKFATIRQVLKSGALYGADLTPTNGSVHLLAYNPNTQSRSFLAAYSPTETKPLYRRFRIHHHSCQNRVKVSVLGRICIRDTYDDTDLIPFDNIRAIKLAAQACNADFNDDVAVAQAKDAQLDKIIEQENQMKKVQVGQPIDVYGGTSAGRIRGINSPVPSLRGVNTFRRW